MLVSGMVREQIVGQQCPNVSILLTSIINIILQKSKTEQLCFEKNQQFDIFIVLFLCGLSRYISHFAHVFNNRIQLRLFLITSVFVTESCIHHFLIIKILFLVHIWLNLINVYIFNGTGFLLFHHEYKVHKHQCNNSIDSLYTYKKKYTIESYLFTLNLNCS